MREEGMASEKFVSLPEAEAKDHLKVARMYNRWSESDRLGEAWFRAHGNTLNVEDDRRLSLEVAREEPRPSLIPDSAMLAGGRIVFACGLLASIVLGSIAVNRIGASDPGALGWFLWTYLAGALAGTGSLFWVAGALEQRLIEVKEELVRSRA